MGPSSPPLNNGSLVWQLKPQGTLGRRRAVGKACLSLVCDTDMTLSYRASPSPLVLVTAGLNKLSNSILKTKFLGTCLTLVCRNHTQTTEFMICFLMPLPSDPQCLLWSAYRRRQADGTPVMGAGQDFLPPVRVGLGCSYGQWSILGSLVYPNPFSFKCRCHPWTA